MGQKLKCLVEQVTWVQVEPLFIEYYGYYFNKFKKRIKKKKIKCFAAIFEQLKEAHSEETSWRVKISKTRMMGRFLLMYLAWMAPYTVSKMTLTLTFMASTQIKRCPLA
ncbi:hypothetical protein A7985_11080 [Pseudoalteromonas luteoviolacea]|uniref:Transposase n=1 Tax=Pseudoalteromonas luteoviolacea TaxID=43657 RepID=A0A1C0TQK6_9GAMM|nr:hypothetical protein [Pseudoalteromonas luteoviolacea]OCQ21170.1 hypothetical protein A7985_11080 [Pseudoalteromonas luteoviolacea]